MHCIHIHCESKHSTIDAFTTYTDVARFSVRFYCRICYEIFDKAHVILPCSTSNMCHCSTLRNLIHSTIFGYSLYNTLPKNQCFTYLVQFKSEKWRRLYLNYWWKSIHSIAVPKNSQNDRVYTPVTSRKREINSTRPSATDMMDLQQLSDSVHGERIWY